MIELLYGDLVKYLGATSEQATWAGATDPRDFLVVGAKYMVKRIEAHSQHTRVYLTDFPGVWFNSVCFVEEGKDDE